MCALKPVDITNIWVSMRTSLPLKLPNRLSWNLYWSVIWVFMIVPQNPNTQLQTVSEISSSSRQKIFLSAMFFLPFSEKTSFKSTYLSASACSVVFWHGLRGKNGRRKWWSNQIFVIMHRYRVIGGCAFIPRKKSCALIPLSTLFTSQIAFNDGISIGLVF